MITVTVQTSAPQVLVRARLASGVAPGLAKLIDDAVVELVTDQSTMTTESRSQKDYWTKDVWPKSMIVELTEVEAVFQRYDNTKATQGIAQANSQLAEFIGTGDPDPVREFLDTALRPNRPTSMEERAVGYVREALGLDDEEGRVTKIISSPLKMTITI